MLPGTGKRRKEASSTPTYEPTELFRKLTVLTQLLLHKDCEESVHLHLQLSLGSGNEAVGHCGERVTRVSELSGRGGSRVERTNWNAGVAAALRRIGALSNLRSNKVDQRGVMHGKNKCK